MKRQPDYWLLLLILCLIGLGCILIVSIAQSPKTLEKHFIAIGLGLAGALLIWRVNPESYRKMIKPLMIISFIMLVLVLIIGGGRDVGSSRSLRLGFIEFQPAELAKYTFILFMAGYLAWRAKKGIRPNAMVTPALVLGAMVVLILLQPALGTSLVMMATFFFYLILVGIPARYWLPVLIGVSVIVGVMILITPYRRERVMHFFIRKHLQGIDYQMYQAKLAIGSGKFWGKGLNQGVQKSYIPAVHTDFVFAVVGEEMGFWGAVLLMFCYLWILVRGFRIAVNSYNPFLFFFAAGLSFAITFQAYLNIGVALWLFPCTGVPLPLISYGGSSLALTIVVMAMLVKISAYDPREKLMHHGAEFFEDNFRR